MRLVACAVAVVFMGEAASGRAQTPLGTAFTYQGRLTDGGSPATGIYDLRCILYDADAGGAQVGPIVARDDVAVTAGVFTIALDFGSVFSGSRRWLEIGVRPGASSGAYTTLSPRQELTPGPAALFSANAATIGGLSCANGQVAKWNGTWTCGADVDTNSGGTVTSVATGAGLTGGPITGSGTLAVAAGGITSAMIADGAVGLAQIDQSQVQARVAGTCPAGFYLRGVNPDGSASCLPLPSVPPAIRSLADVAAGVASAVAIAVGSDGLPVIGYEAPGGSLRVVKCGNLSCTAGNIDSPVDDPDNLVGDHVSIAVGSDGRPVFAYQDMTAGALKFAKCGNAACSSGNTIQTIDDPANVVGLYTSIKIGADDLPVISYHDETAFRLKVAKCGNATCTSGNVITSPEAGPFVGTYTTLAIGLDGLPVIGHRSDNSGSLEVLKCGNLACTSGNTATSVDGFGNAGGHSSMAVPADGRPVVSHYSFGSGVLRLSKCGNPACSSGNTSLTLEDTDDPVVSPVGFYTSLAIGTDGLPVVSYLGPGVTTLKVAKCGNADCSAGNTLSVVDSANRQTSIAIGSDGLPVIAYRLEGLNQLKVAKCGHVACR